VIVNHDSMQSVIRIGKQSQTFLNCFSQKFQIDVHAVWPVPDDILPSMSVRYSAVAA